MKNTFHMFDMHLFLTLARHEFDEEVKNYLFAFKVNLVCSVNEKKQLNHFLVSEDNADKLIDKLEDEVYGLKAWWKDDQ